MLPRYSATIAAIKTLQNNSDLFKFRYPLFDITARCAVIKLFNWSIPSSIEQANVTSISAINKT